MATVHQSHGRCSVHGPAIDSELEELSTSYAHRRRHTSSFITIHTTTTLLSMLCRRVRPNHRLTSQQQFFPGSLPDIATRHYCWKIRDRICDWIGSGSRSVGKLQMGVLRIQGVHLRDLEVVAVVEGISGV